MPPLPGWAGVGGLLGAAGGVRWRRLLMSLGILGALLIGVLADHVRRTTVAYQVQAAQHGVALTLTLQARQEMRAMLGRLLRSTFEDDAGHGAALAAAFPALEQRLAALAALRPRHDAPGLATLQQSMPVVLEAAAALGRRLVQPGLTLPDATQELLPLLDAIDGPLRRATELLDRDARELARAALLRLAGELLFFAMGFLLLVASTAVLTLLLMLAWRRTGSALALARAAGDEARAAGDEARAAGDEARAAGDEARAAHRGLGAMVDHVPAMIATFDLDLRCVHANRAVLGMSGLSADQVIGRTVGEFALNPALERDLRTVLATGQPITPTEHELRNRAGQTLVLVSSTVPILDPEGRLHRILRTSLDITERREAERRARHLSGHDALTDLPNRLRFREELTAWLADPGTGLALHLLDLDGFRSVNDTHGQAVGDALLLAVGRRLSGLVGRDDVLARLGGDEFALLQTISGHAEATALAARITQALAQPYQLAPRHIRCSASLGVAVQFGPGMAAETMLARADLALASAKREGIGRFMAFRAEMEGEAQQRRALQAELVVALTEGLLHLAYQPKFAMEDGRLEGVEALLRWRHPERGDISPGEFVPLAEEAGLAMPLARFVLTRATSQIRTWLDQGLRIPVAVNLSGELIGMGETLHLVESVLEDSGVPASLLEIEVTESTFIGDSEAARAMLLGLRALGIRVALDDFGTGFSSLAYLQELPIDVLKVDRSFVHGLTSGGGGASARIVDTVVRLAHGLGATVVAEGVETPEQLEVLRRLGCDSVQGFLLGRPQRAEQIPALLAPKALAVPA